MIGVGPWCRTGGLIRIDRVAGLSEKSPCRDTDPIALSSSVKLPRSFSAARRCTGWASATTSLNLIRVWVEKYEAGALDEDARAADMVQEYEARIAALERLVGRRALELEFLKGALRSTARPRSATTSVIIGPAASPSPRDVG